MDICERSGDAHKISGSLKTVNTRAVTDTDTLEFFYAISALIIQTGHPDLLVRQFDLFPLSKLKLKELNTGVVYIYFGESPTFTFKEGTTTDNFSLF